MADEKTSFIKSVSNFVSNSFNNDDFKEQLKKKDDEIFTTKKMMEELGAQVTEPSVISQDSKELNDIMNEMASRVDPRNFKTMYLRNQFINRGVNKRASEMITRGYKIDGEDEVGIEKCTQLIKNSGGSQFLKQSSVNTDVFGNSYWEQVPSKGGKDILLLKHIHPLIFGFEYDEATHVIKIGPDKTPKSYAQKIIDPNTSLETYKSVPKNIITHIKFNTFGDEFSGISTLQPLFDTAVRLMNMEKSAAVAAIKTANPVMVLTTDAKSPVLLAKWMKIVGKITGQQQVSLGENQKLEFLSPEKQLFSDYVEYYLDAVVAALEVPKAILLGQGGSNRAETITLSKEFQKTIRDNQQVFETEIDKIFEKYGEMAGFKPPKFSFIDVAEDSELLAEKAVKLFDAGLISIEEAREMIGLLGPGKNLPSQDVDKEVKEADAKSWHPAKAGSPEGSQSENKKSMKRSADVIAPSVK